MMRRPLLAAFALVAVSSLAGCSKGPKDKLQGRWLGDSIQNVPDAQSTAATGWVKGTSFEFKGDKVTVTVPAEEPRTGSFAIAKVNGNHITVQFARPSGDPDEATFTLDGEKKMTWDIGNDRQVTLVRASL